VRAVKARRRDFFISGCIRTPQEIQSKELGKPVAIIVVKLATGRDREIIE